MISQQKRMRRSFSIFLIGFLLILNPFASAQELPRGFDRNVFKELQSNEQYQYELIKPTPEGFLERLWDRFVNWFWGLFQAEGSRSAIDILFKLFIAVAFVYFMARVFGGDITGVFKSSDRKVDFDYTLNEENIAEINFEKEIEQAIVVNNYRLVIRLYYLWTLKKASAYQWVELAQGKTNHEYLYELKGRPIESDFRRLSHLFDYTWYGHFEADEALAQKARAVMDNIDKLREEGSNG